MDISSMGWYILDKDNNPVRCNTMEEKIEYDKTYPTRKILGRTHIGEQRISTVFLGLEHGHGYDKHVLWETMIFGGDNDQYQERYNSHDKAMRGHEEIVINIVMGKTYCNDDDKWKGEK